MINFVNSWRLFIWKKDFPFYNKLHELCCQKRAKYKFSLSFSHASIRMVIFWGRKIGGNISGSIHGIAVAGSLFQSQIPPGRTGSRMHIYACARSSTYCQPGSRSHGRVLLRCVSIPPGERVVGLNPVATWIISWLDKLSDPRGSDRVCYN